MPTPIHELIGSEMADTLSRLGPIHVRALANMACDDIRDVEVTLQLLPRDVVIVLVHQGLATQQDGGSIKFSPQLQELLIACQAVMNEINTTPDSVVAEYIFSEDR